MKATPTPFERAWLLIKGQPLGIKFTNEEEQFINTALHDAMTSKDAYRKSEAKELFLECLNHN